jgi:hypothetical protein
MHMPNRTAKFASAIVAGLLASAPLAAVSQSATPPADDCLTTPKDKTPQGSHWYYRLEHGTKRHCWYLREEGDAGSQAASPNSTASAKPVAPQTETATQGTAMQGSVANARAELRSPQTRSEPDTSVAATGVATTQLPSAAAANTTSADNNQRAPGQDASMLQTAVASRWPDQLSTSSSDNSAPDEANSDTPAQPSEMAAPPSPSATASTAPVTLAAADASSEKQSSEKQSVSVPMLLIVMTSALAIAGLVGGAVVKFSGKRRDDRQDEDHQDEDYEETQRDRRAIWDLERIERSRPLPFPATAAQRPNIGVPRELRTADSPDDRIKEMLARLARSAQS